MSDKRPSLRYGYSYGYPACLLRMAYYKTEYHVAARSKHCEQYLIKGPARYIKCKKNWPSCCNKEQTL